MITKEKFIQSARQVYPEHNNLEDEQFYNTVLNLHPKYKEQIADDMQSPQPTNKIDELYNRAMGAGQPQQEHSETDQFQDWKNQTLQNTPDRKVASEINKLEKQGYDQPTIQKVVENDVIPTLTAEDSKKLQEQGNLTPYEKNLQEQTNSLNKELENNPDMMEYNSIYHLTDEQKNKAKLNLADKWHEVKDDPIKLLPYLSGIKESSELLEVLGAARRAEKGEATENDITTLKEYQEFLNKDKSRGYQVLDVVANMVPYALELATTWGFYSSAKTATMKTGKKVLQSMMKSSVDDLIKAGTIKGTAVKLGGHVVGSAVGSIPQAVIGGSAQIAAGTVRRQIPTFDIAKELPSFDEVGKSFVESNPDLAASMSPQELSEFISGEYIKSLNESVKKIDDGQSIPIALRNSIVSQYKETFSEHAGGTVDVLVGNLGKKAIFQAFMKSKPGATVQKFRSALKKFGWNGMIVEIGEERVAEGLGGIFHKMGIGDEPYQRPTMDQLTTEAIAFAIPGVTFAGINQGINAYDKHQAKKAQDQHAREANAKMGERQKDDPNYQQHQPYTRPSAQQMQDDMFKRKDNEYQQAEAQAEQPLSPNDISMDDMAEIIIENNPDITKSMPPEEFEQLVAQEYDRYMAEVEKERQFSNMPDIDITQAEPMAFEEFYTHPDYTPQTGSETEAEAFEKVKQDYDVYEAEFHAQKDKGMINVDEHNNTEINENAPESSPETDIFNTVNKSNDPLFEQAKAEILQENPGIDANMSRNDLNQLIANRYYELQGQQAEQQETEQKQNFKEAFTQAFLEENPGIENNISAEEFNEIVDEEYQKYKHSGENESAPKKKIEKKEEFKSEPDNKAELEEAEQGETDKNDKPIGIDNQIEDALEGQTPEQKAEIDKKVKRVTSNVDNITKINGKKVYDVSIDKERGDLRYNLRKSGKNENQKYYYPIQYADIEYDTQETPKKTLKKKSDQNIPADVPSVQTVTKPSEQEAVSDNDEYQEKFSTPQSQKNDKSGDVEVIVNKKIETIENQEIKTYTFETKTTNKKGEPRTIEQKGYDSIDNAVEELGIIEDDDFNLDFNLDFHREQGDKLILTKIKIAPEGSRFKSVADVVIGGTKYTLEIKPNNNKTNTPQSNNSQTNPPTENKKKLVKKSEAVKETEDVLDKVNDKSAKKQLVKPTPKPIPENAILPKSGVYKSEKSASGAMGLKKLNKSEHKIVEVDGGFAIVPTTFKVDIDEGVLNAIDFDNNRRHYAKPQTMSYEDNQGFKQFRRAKGGNITPPLFQQEAGNVSKQDVETIINNIRNGKKLTENQYEKWQILQNAHDSQPEGEGIPKQANSLGLKPGDKIKVTFDGENHEAEVVTSDEFVSIKTEDGIEKEYAPWDDINIISVNGKHTDIDFEPVPNQELSDEELDAIFNNIPTDDVDTKQISKVVNDNESEGLNNSKKESNLNHEERNIRKTSSTDEKSETNQPEQPRSSSEGKSKLQAESESQNAPISQRTADTDQQITNLDKELTELKKKSDKINDKIDKLSDLSFLGTTEANQNALFGDERPGLNKLLNETTEKIKATEAKLNELNKKKLDLEEVEKGESSGDLFEGEADYKAPFEMEFDNYDYTPKNATDILHLTEKEYLKATATQYKKDNPKVIKSVKRIIEDGHVKEHNAYHKVRDLLEWGEFTSLQDIYNHYKQYAEKASPIWTKALDFAFDQALTLKVDRMYNGEYVFKDDSDFEKIKPYFRDKEIGKIVEYFESKESLETEPEQSKSLAPFEGAYYILNSDNKIELHLPDKKSYSNLPDNVKKDIKSGFVWGRQRGAWVSRSKGGHKPYSMSNYTIEYKGSDDLKSFDDMQEQKVEKASNKADRLRDRADRKEDKAKSMQSEFNRMRGDWSWLTQPNVNSSGGRAFTKSRNRIMDRYDRGRQELSDAENLKERADALDFNATQSELQDEGYLRNRIKENQKLVDNFPAIEEKYNNAMENNDNISDEDIMYWDGVINRYKLGMEKYAYYQNALNELIEKKKEKGNYFNEIERKKTIKKDWKDALKKHFDIDLTSMSIGYKVKSGTSFDYRTKQPLPKFLLGHYASDNFSRGYTREIDALIKFMDKHIPALKETGYSTEDIIKMSADEINQAVKDVKEKTEIKEPTEENKNFSGNLNDIDIYDPQNLHRDKVGTDELNEYLKWANTGGKNTYLWILDGELVQHKIDYDGQIFYHSTQRMQDRKFHRQSLTTYHILPIVENITDGIEQIQIKNGDNKSLINFDQLEKNEVPFPDDVEVEPKNIAGINITLRDNSTKNNKQTEIIKVLDEDTTEIIGSIDASFEEWNDWFQLQVEKTILNSMDNLTDEAVEYFQSDNSAMFNEYGVPVKIKKHLEKESTTPEQTPVSNKPTYKSLKETHDQIRKGNTTPEQIRENFAIFLESKESIEQEIGKEYTIKQLKDKVWSDSSDKKGDLVRKYYDGLMASFRLGKGVQYDPFDKNSYERAVRTIIDNVTQEQIDEYAAEAEATEKARKERFDKLMKSVTNPETLDEFNIFIKSKGIENLTTEQRTKYDELTTPKKELKKPEPKKVLKKLESKPIEKPTENDDNILIDNNLSIVEDQTKAGKPYWLVKGSGTFAHKDLLKSLGAKWSKWKKGWAFYGENPESKISNALQGRNENVSQVNENSGRSESNIDPMAEKQRLKQLRIEQDSRSDDRGTVRNLEEYANDHTKTLIRRGKEFGIPKDVLENQIEDVQLINRAFQNDKSIFLLANEAGTGKTFVLGGAIQEMKAAGAKKILYVTMNNDLVDQIQRDLKDYDIGGVEFVTYSKMRKMASDATYDVVIFDESQNIKNLDSKQGKKGASLVDNAKFSIYASATPFENPVETEYFKPTGIFDPVGGFVDFCKIYGAAIRTYKYYDYTAGQQVTREIPYWQGGKVADGKAAREWFFKQGIMTQRAMKLPPDMVETNFIKVKVDQELADLYNNITDAMDDAIYNYSEVDNDPNLAFQLGGYKTNLQKRLLEHGKVDAGIAQAEKHLADGKQVVIFVETKAERFLDVDGVLEAMEAYEMTKALGDEGRPHSKVVEATCKALHNVGIHKIELPSTEKTIFDHFGRDNVAIYTGAVTNVKAIQNKNDWMAGKKKILVATMAKGGTGLSLHDTVGNRPTAQVNINMPWKAYGVDQVSGRTARYGLKSKAIIEWIFAENINFDQTLAGKVGQRMRDMGAIVKGIDSKAAQVLMDWDFENASIKRQSAEQYDHKNAPKASEEDLYEKAERLERSRRKADDTSGGFFETPYPLAVAMSKIANVKSGDYVLEPSAGKGSLIRFLPEGVHKTIVEQRPDNFNISSKLADEAHNTDFINFTPDREYDAIIMNPPFERVKGIGAQDIAHIQKAYSHLADEGRLVAIMGEGAFFRSFQQDKDFREWLDEVGVQVVKLPENTFKKSGTGVNARMLVIDKNDDSGRTDYELANIENVRDLEDFTGLPGYNDRISFSKFSSHTPADMEWNRKAQEILEKNSRVKGVKYLTNDEFIEMVAKHKKARVPKAQWETMSFMKDFGAYYRGIVYINKDKANKDTIFHEFAHPFVDGLKQSDPALYRQGMDLIEKSPYITWAASSGYEVNFQEEALVQAIAEKGAEIQDQALRNKFMAWIKKVWFKFAIKMKQMFGAKVTLDDFTTAMALRMRENKLRNEVVGEMQMEMAFQGEKNNPAASFITRPEAETIKGKHSPRGSSKDNISKNNEDAKEKVKMVSENRAKTTNSVYQIWQYKDAICKVRFSDHDSNVIYDDSDLSFDIENKGTETVRDQIKLHLETKSETQLHLSYGENYNILGHDIVERIGGFVYLKDKRMKKYHKNQVNSFPNKEQFISSAKKEGNYYYKEGYDVVTLTAKEFHRRYKNVKFNNTNPDIRFQKGYNDYTKEELTAMYEKKMAQIRAKRVPQPTTKQTDGIKKNLSKNIEKIKDSDKPLEKKKKTLEKKLPEDGGLGDVKRIHERTLVKQAIKNYESGFKQGKIKGKAELKAVQDMIVKYAREFLPRNEMTRGQVNQLLTKIRDAKDIDSTIKAYEKIEEIYDAVEKKIITGKIKKLLKKNLPKKNKQGQLKSKISADPQVVVELFNRATKLKGEEKENALAYIDNMTDMNEQEAEEVTSKFLQKIEGKQLTENDSQLYHLLGTFLDLKNQSLENLHLAYKNLKDIIELGRTEWQNEQHVIKLRNNKIADRSVDMIYGDDIDLKNRRPDETKHYDKTKSVVGQYKKWSFVTGDWKHNLDKLSSRDGSKPFDSIMNRTLGKWADKSTLQEINSLSTTLDHLRINIAEKLGVRIEDDTNFSKRLVGHNRKKNSFKKIQELSKQNKTKAFKNVLDSDGFAVRGRDGKVEQRELELNRLEAMQYYMWWQDEYFAPTFKKMGYTQETMDALETYMGQNVKDLADWLLNDFYTEYGKTIDPIFVKMNGMHMRLGHNYSPGVRDNIVSEKEDDLFAQHDNILSNIIPGSTMVRVNSTKPLKKTNALNNLIKHVYDMEHYKAWAETVRDMRSIMSRVEMKNAITQIHGSKVYRTIIKQIDMFARGGVDKKLSFATWEKWTNNITKGMLFYKLPIMTKQFASSVAVIGEMSPVEIIKYYPKNPKRFGEIVKKLADSYYTKDRRYHGHTDAVMEAYNDAPVKQLTGYRLKSETGGLFIAFGDFMGATLGGVAIYEKHYQEALAQGKDKQLAHDKAFFEFFKYTEKWQQSGKTMSMSVLQQEGSYGKVITKWSNAPMGLARNFQSGARNLKAGRGDKGYNISQMIAATMVNALFLMMGSGLFFGTYKGWERFKDNFSLQFIQTIFFNGIGTIMEAFMYGLNKATGFGNFQALKVEEAIDEMGKASGKIMKFIEEPNRKNAIKAADQVAVAIDMNFTGLGYQGVRNFVKGNFDAHKDIFDDETITEMKRRGLSDDDNQFGLATKRRRIGFSAYSEKGMQSYQNVLLENAVNDGESWKKTEFLLEKYYEKYLDKKIAKQTITRYKKKFDAYKTFGFENNVVNYILKATPSNEQKAERLYQFRQDVGQKEFNKFYYKASSTGILSKDIMTKYARLF